MACTEVVEGALATLQITRDAVLLAQGVEGVVATGDQLVGVGLVTHIPNNPVSVEVKGLIQGEGELHHPQAWAEVTTARAHHFQVTLADLAGDAFELSNAEAMQLIGMRQLAEMHACGQDWGSAYAQQDVIWVEFDTPGPMSGACDTGVIFQLQ